MDRVRSDRPGRPPSSQSSTARRTVYVADVCRPRSSSACSALSLSLTSCLVRPVTLRRVRLPVLGGVEVDRVFAVATTAHCGVRHNRERSWERSSLAPRLAPCDGSRSPERGSDLVVRDRIELSTFRFSGVLSPGK